MIASLPIYIVITFIATTLLAVWLFARTFRTAAPAFSRQLVVLLLLWLCIQALLAFKGVYYTASLNSPPKIMFLGILRAMLGVVWLLLSGAGRKLTDQMSLRDLTWIHVARVPVELVLFWLYKQQVVPQLMTFEGRNFDIIAGLTAPLVILLGLGRKQWPPLVLLCWNFLCLGFLCNIVLTALLSAPSPFQQLAFDQPNIALFYFPFCWLPACIVPLVLFAHLAAIRKLVIGLRSK